MAFSIIWGFVVILEANVPVHSRHVTQRHNHVIWQVSLCLSLSAHLHIFSALTLKHPNEL